MKAIKPLCMYPHFITCVVLAWYFLPFAIGTALAWLTLPVSSHLLSFAIIYTTGMYAGYQARIVKVDIDTQLSELPTDDPDESN